MARQVARIHGTFLAAALARDIKPGEPAAALSVVICNPLWQSNRSRPASADGFEGIEHALEGLEIAFAIVAQGDFLAGPDAVLNLVGIIENEFDAVGHGLGPARIDQYGAIAMQGANAGDV